MLQIRWIFLFLLPFSCWSFDNTPECFFEIERTFFSPQIVGQGLSLYGIPQIQWMNIAKDLSIETENIHLIIREKAGNLRPDPTEPPFNRNVTASLLQQTFYDIFVRVLAKYEIKDENLVQNIFQ